MKTVAQLPSGKKPVGTTTYMGRAQHLIQCRSSAQKGCIFFSISNLLAFFTSFTLSHTSLLYFTLHKSTDSVLVICIYTYVGMQLRIG